MIGVLCGLFCLVALLAVAFLRRRNKRPAATNLSSPSPPTEVVSRSSQSAVNSSDGSSVSSGQQQWQPHELEAGKGGMPVDVDMQRQLGGGSSVGSSGLSERSMYHTASGTMVFVHD